MKNYDENKESSFLEYSDGTTCMVGQCQNHYLLVVLTGWKICLK